MVIKRTSYISFQIRQMPNSSSFDKKLYEQLKINISIHKALLELNSENLQQTTNSLINNKKIVGSKEGILVLCRSIIDIVSFNPKNLKDLTDLFISLQNSKSSIEDNYLQLLPQYIVQCIHTRENLRMSALYFLRRLVLRQSISINSIINELNNLPPFNDKKSSKIVINDSNSSTPINDDDIIFENENFQGQLIDQLSPYTQSNNKKYRILMMFYPEIKAIKDNLNLNKILNVPNRYSFDPVTFHNFLNKGDNPGSIATIIRNDDIDTFQTFITKSGDPNIKNQKIKDFNTFEKFTILSSEPSFIQYSAFFNSIKIFKYLLLIKADTDTTPSLVDFVVAGGSVEIIHILAQNHLHMESGIVTAIRFYRNDIFGYLLDNFMPKSRLEFDLMDNLNFRTKEEKGFSEGIQKLDSPDFPFNLNNEGEFDYLYNDHDPFNMDYKEKFDVENENNENDEKFMYFNFDVVFQAIVESNNLLALFILFDNGMKINQRDKLSKRTLLHWAVQKGKTFLCKLLLSNKYINTSLVDKYGESPIVYAVKYGKLDIFFEFMKSEKVTNTLKTWDYLLMANYANFNGLQKVTDYLLKNFKFDLIELAKQNDRETFCDIVFFVPIFYLFNKIELVLEETFLNDNLYLFDAVVSRIIIDETLKISADFYYNSDDGKDIRYESILSSYYRSFIDDERYQKLFNVYQNLHEYDEFSYDKFGFRFHRIEGKKPYCKITFSHPLLHKYMKS